jgi:hypothetical protein
MDKVDDLTTAAVAAAQVHLRGIINTCACNRNKAWLQHAQEVELNYEDIVMALAVEYEDKYPGAAPLESDAENFSWSSGNESMELVNMDLRAFRIRARRDVRPHVEYMLRSLALANPARFRELAADVYPRLMRRLALARAKRLRLEYDGRVLRPDRRVLAEIKERHRQQEKRRRAEARRELELEDAAEMAALRAARAGANS